jgi:hypothetical protein
VKNKELAIRLPELTPGLDFNFFSMHNFNISFNAKIDKLIFNEKDIWSNIKAKGTSQEGVLLVEELSGELFKGKVLLYGNMIFITQFPNFKCSFSIANVVSSEMLGFLYNYQNIDGYLSAVGNFTTDGYNKKTLFDRMYGNTTFVAKKLKIDGFDIGEIIKTTEGTELLPTVRIDRLKDAIMNGKSIFDDLQGKGEVKAGILYLKNINLSNNRVQGVYSAALDLQDALINGMAKLSFVPQDTFQALTMDISNKGSILKQDINWNVSKITDYLSQQANNKQQKSGQETLLKR